MASHIRRTRPLPPLSLLAGPALASSLAPRAAQAATCTELAKLALPKTTITVAEEIRAGAFKPSSPPEPGAPKPPGATFTSLPAFCRVAGTIRPTSDSDIRFEVWMPAAGWNGKFVGVGNGVWAGSISYLEMVAPLLSGYATAATDDGHQGSLLDASFAAGHPEKLTDFGHRAPHEMTVAAKATIAAFYGRRAERSLFVSCSTGGRQGLMEAHRYPEDYDGISSMAPATSMAAVMVNSLWTGHVALKDCDSHLTPAKLALVHQAALEACDAADGVKDGVISSPRACRFDPASLQCKSGDTPDCLTAPQVSALKAIYAGSTNVRTGRPIYPGFEVGSEAMLPIYTSAPFPAALSYMRALVFKDPTWDFHSFDYDCDVTRALDVAAADLDVPATGLDRFFAAGRKLLLMHGWADGLIPPMATVNFYTDLTRHLGAQRAERGVRLFMAPGVGHCSGGDGPSVIDWTSAIDQWVGSGSAPRRILASNPPGAAPRTRPLCNWPLVATYTGTGSTDDEKNFRCRAAGP